MLQVPFYPNHEDNMRCMLAAYASILDYFWGQPLDWSELIRLTGYQPKRAAWTVKALTELASKGMDIRMIEPFDYRRFSIEGEAYLKTYMSQEQLDWQLEHTNIMDIKPLIPQFLRTIHYERHRPTISDIDRMLSENRLVFITVNARSLNDKPGFVSHAVLVFDQSEDEYILHDPGNPPKPYRHVKKSKLYEAMGGNQTTSEVTGFKLK